MYEDEHYVHEAHQPEAHWFPPWSQGEEEEAKGCRRGLLLTEDEEDEGYDTQTTGGIGGSPYSEECEKESLLPAKEDEEAVANPNLMWLLDFKLDFFNDGGPSEQHQQQQLAAKGVLTPNGGCGEKESQPKKDIQELVNPPSSTDEIEERWSNTENNSNKIYEKTTKKPPYTYTELITQALKDKTALTVSGIYQWIMDQYLFFKAEDDRWKNSVRHNLSMNPHFRKGTKSKQGAGHLWVLADYEEDSCLAGPEESGGASPCLEEDEAAKAVKSILDSEEQKLAAAAAAASRIENPESPSCPSSEQQLTTPARRSKRKRGYQGPNSPEDFPPPQQQSFSKPQESLMQGESYVVQELSGSDVSHGQEVFIAETGSMTSLLEPGAKRLFLELRPEDHPHPPLGGTPEQQQQLHSLPIHTGAPNVVASHVEISSQHIPFSPMEDMEELGVAGYCYEADVTSLENALGFDFHQKQLLAK